MIRQILTAAAISSLIATPVMASSAAPLSVSSVQRSGAAVGDESELSAPGSFIGIALFAAVIIGGIILVATDDDDGDDIDTPVSP